MSHSNIKKNFFKVIKSQKLFLIFIILFTLYQTSTYIDFNNLDRVFSNDDYLKYYILYKKVSYFYENKKLWRPQGINCYDEIEFC